MKIEEEAPALASMIHVADPKASIQLTKGFHEIEQNSWRWTMGRFGVTLKPPQGANQQGARLVLKFSIPDPVTEKLQAITLSASVGGVALPPEVYPKPGEQAYVRDVPASAFQAEAVAVDFALDKFLARGAVDERELGVVVSSVGFEAK